MTDRHLPPTLLKYCPHLITLGRPRRTPKANEHGVIPLEYTKRDFEERNRSVMDFTIAIRTRNRDVAKRELSKEEVSEQYALIMFSCYVHTPKEVANAHVTAGKSSLSRILGEEGRGFKGTTINGSHWLLGNES